THNFTFTSEADAEMAATFNPPVTLASDTKNFTFAVDIASWFTDASGAVIDPTNAANAEAIARNIERSARVFEDDNHDGADEHVGGHVEPGGLALVRDVHHATRTPPDQPPHGRGEVGRVGGAARLIAHHLRGASRARPLPHGPGKRLAMHAEQPLRADNEILGAARL